MKVQNSVSLCVFILIYFILKRTNAHSFSLVKKLPGHLKKYKPTIKKIENKSCNVCSKQC